SFTYRPGQDTNSGLLCPKPPGTPPPPPHPPPRAPIGRPPPPPGGAHAQPRSRATMGRLLAAVEEAIAERGVASLTVQEVARRAGLAAGTLYTRFAGKDALLRAFTIAFF